jgi:hypothetical protein
MPFSSLGLPLAGYTGFIQMQAVKSISIGYDADAGLPYPHPCILFFTASNDGMTQNGLQEKAAYPTRGERMKSKLK